MSSLSLVRYKTNDYSVPVAYGHRDVLVRGYVDRVVISCGSGVIPRHHRSYQRDDFVFDPVHYLPLLEQKTAALDQAAPLQGWDLPEEFGTLRRLLESRRVRSSKVRALESSFVVWWMFVAAPTLAYRIAEKGVSVKLPCKLSPDTTISGQNVSLSHVHFDILGDYYACRCPQDDVDRPQ